MGVTRFPYGLALLRPGSSNFAMFAEADSNPSVKNGSFFLAHTSAVTIQNFDDGEEGQIINILSLSEGITTISNNATIKVKSPIFTIGTITVDSSGITASTSSPLLSYIGYSNTAGNLKMEANEVVPFIYQSGIWYEMKCRGMHFA